MTPPPPPISTRPVSLAQAFDSMRADYDAAKSNRLRRRRSGLATSGASADYHYRNELEYLRLIEMARDLVRNNQFLGAMIRRAVDVTIQGGILPKPNTGDTGLNTELMSRWDAWAADAANCDLACELNWHQMTRLVLEQHLVDGDICALPNRDTGAIELVEAHRLRTPHNTSRNVVHGVMLEESTRKRQEYWFTREEIDPHKQVQRVSDMIRVPAWDREGFRQVFHVYMPRRATQTRGVTALHPIFDATTMLADVDFAKLVQQQVVSSFAILRQYEATVMDQAAPQYGDRSTETYPGSAGGVRYIDQIAPGMEIIGAPGEKLTGFSPSVPNPEYFEQYRTILQIISVNLGLPLIAFLLDASETNFSGWRGALDIAKKGWEANQEMLISRLHQPVWDFKVRGWLATDAAMRRAVGSTDQVEINRLFNVTWNRPAWPYIEPLKDAQADALRLEKGLISPRRLHAERGRDWNEIVVETIADREFAIVAANEAAERIKTRFPDAGVTWRDCISIAGIGPAPAAAGGLPNAPGSSNGPGGGPPPAGNEDEEDDEEAEDGDDDDA